MAFTQILNPPSRPAPSRTASSIYGSEFASEDMPTDKLPEGAMPKTAAYRMITDELALDGKPMLNLASFCTTYMEDEAEKLIIESANKNVIDHDEYRMSNDVEQRCLKILANMFHSPEKYGKSTAVGTACIGSSEAIMLAALAMKKRWKNQRKAEGKDTSEPNIIMSTGVQVCWKKAAAYFEIEEKYVPCTETRYVIDPVQAVDLVDENTIGICAILGTTYTGQYEDVKEINDLLVRKGLDIPIHVDAASGGFVAPFVNPGLKWDFQLPQVASINVSGHKYGLVYPGIGWALWRSIDFLPQELVFNINYLGADQLNFTLNFSKPASHIIAQYYQMIRLGRQGYHAIMSNLTRTADNLASHLRNMGFLIMSDGAGKGLPVVAFRLSAAHSTFFDEFAVSRKLRERGWIVPAYTMAADCEKMCMMRVVVREDFTQSRCGRLIHDIEQALQALAKEELRYQALLQSHFLAPQKLCLDQDCRRSVPSRREESRLYQE